MGFWAKKHQREANGARTAVVAYIGKPTTAVGEIPNKCKWSHDVKGVERTKLAKGEKNWGVNWSQLKHGGGGRTAHVMRQVSPWQPSSLSSPALCLRRFRARAVGHGAGEAGGGERRTAAVGA